MEKESILDNFRVPILNTIYRNPFEGLGHHSKKLDECVFHMKECLFHYLECDFDRVEKDKEMVSKAEHEADLIKANIRAHIPKSIFMPVPKDQFHMLLHDADSILDYAEDVAVLLTMKRTCLPENISGKLRELAKKVLDCVNAFQDIMGSMENLIESSFRGLERDRVKDMIKRVHLLEHEADILEFSISRDLFNIDHDKMDPISVVHMLKVVDRLGQVADKAENAADRIRAMMAK